MADLIIRGIEMPKYFSQIFFERKNHRASGRRRRGWLRWYVIAVDKK